MAIGIFRQMLLLGGQILQKLDDIDCQMTKMSTKMSEIEGELDKVNRSLLILIAEEAPEDVTSFDVRVDKPVSQ